MSPIDKISDIRRLPRLGMIRLGIKKEGDRCPYPQAVNYFVCPDEVKEVYGDKPTELDVMFPENDLELVAPQWYKCYSYSQGLICKGDGKKCRRKVDVITGDFASRDTREWEMAEGICEPEHCHMIGSKQCRKMMSLLFILPEVPRLGVYQLNTGSFYSIVNINSQIAPDGFIRPFTKGKISFIPLKLSIGPQEVTPPGVGRKTIQTLKLWADVKLADIIRISRQRPAQVLLPTLEEEEPPDDLYPEDLLAEAEVIQEEEVPPEPEREGETPPKGEEETGEPLTLGNGKVGATTIAPTEVHLGRAGGVKAVKHETSPTEETSPEEAIEGESFHIDPTWLDETLKEIKWSEDTAKTWIGAQFKVDTSGGLTEVIKRLTREQAQEFVNEIQERANKKQLDLFK